MISDVCYAFLENPSIKPSKDIRVEIFNILGTLIKSHNQDASFVFLSIQLLKSCDHLVNCLAEGIQILVENYNCKTLVQKFVGDMAEWLTNQEFQDNQVKYKKTFFFIGTITILFFRALEIALQYLLKWQF